MKGITRNRLILFVLAMFDYLNISLFTATLAPLVMGVNYQLLPESWASEKIIVLGVLFAVTPFCEFFTAPFIGNISDKIGRKKVLLVTMTGNTLGIFLAAAAVYFHVFILLILARALNGIFGNNIALAQSGMADSVTKKRKGFELNWIEVAIGFGLILGPCFPGWIIHFYQIPRIALSASYAIGGLFNVLAIVAISFYRDEKALFHGNIRSALQVKKAFLFLIDIWPKRSLLMVWFIFIGGWMIYFHYFTLLLTQQFQASLQDISSYFVYFGFCYLLFQLFFVPWICRFFSPEQILPYSMSVAGIAVILFAVMPSMADMKILLLIYIPAMASTMPNILALISNQFSETVQGKVFSELNVIVCLIKFILVLVGANLASITPVLPIVVGGSIMFWGAILLILLCKDFS